ncbi:30S ribosomal protein S17 [candidate division WOR-1 bacterium RIFCSPHIGHO2_01_FULL_53_15]|uniref:Small ribosomal subunit protein uS17 n=1 Tax=candidate division WOR-1 bacterium RIFCSPHIGHO2_01_FULL_53_15 TaxID=1802564 RepID=A0A1F4Q3H4_UNCSA|nr:MAG: 30S ribosomal protein S17 [candidate division WOR-1 bacterium RIFCSPHIGHO2_01_FULL_53_15]OGC12507.1 MAG: 30S ribosomal protein S17 [candidate division WOR-1 bacterium RIFCSPHIGHO2_02_FULL_53_26]
MERGKTKIKEGVVVSDKMKKTVVVRVERVFRHPEYQKVMRVSKKFKAHDEAGVCRVGDRVEIMACRPLSADKCWRVVRRLKIDSKSQPS